MSPGDLTSFIEVGQALAEVRDHHLYRDRFASFDDYCRQRWGLSGEHANHLIGVAEQYAARGLS